MKHACLCCRATSRGRGPDELPGGLLADLHDGEYLRLSDSADPPTRRAPAIRVSGMSGCLVQCLLVPGTYRGELGVGRVLEMEVKRLGLGSSFASCLIVARRIGLQ